MRPRSGLFRRSSRSYSASSVPACSAQRRFGAYVSIFAVAGLLSVATSVGLPGLLQREISASRGGGDRSALKPLVQGLTVINGVLLIGLVAASVSGLEVAALVLAFAILGNAAGLLGSLFIAHERVLLASWIANVLRPTTALAALFALAMLTTPSKLLPLYAQLLGVVAAIVALLLLWRGEPLTNARRAFSVSWWSDRHPAIVRAGVTFAGIQLLINLTTQVDILILTAMAPPGDVAHYYAAVRAALVVNFFFGSSGLLAEPALTRLFAAKEHGEFQRLATRTAVTGATVTLLAAVAAVAVAPYYLGLYGPDFVVAFPSFCVFTAGILARSFFGPAAPMLRATRAEGSLFVITAIVLAFNAVVSVMLIPHFGITGAAIGSGLQFAIYGALLARALQRRSAVRSDVFASFQAASER